MISIIKKSLKVKGNNKELVLKSIFRNGIVSRVDVAKELNLSKPTVNELVETFLKLGIVMNAGEGTSAKQGGRRPLLIAPNPRYKYILAVDLDYLNTVVALVNLCGAPVDRILIHKKIIGKNLCRLLERYIDDLIDRNKLSFSEIAVLIISIPGIVKGEIGSIVFNTQFNGLSVSNLKHNLEEKYKLDVILENDVNMALMGEARYLKNYKNILFISCGVGLGAALILDGRLYEGENFSAGKLNDAISYETRKCIAETLCLNWFLNEVKIATKNNLTTIKKYEKVTFERAIQAFHEDDKIIIELVKKIGLTLGVIINNTISFIDVRLVVVGGDYLAFQDTIIPQIESVLHNAPSILKPTIVPTSLAQASGVIGCYETGVNYIIKSLTV